MSEYFSSGAIISEDERYRYVLFREWRGHGSDENWRWFDAVDGNGHKLGVPKTCLFIMLNPSTADALNDDPTIRRCVSFAKAWKYDRLEVVNLFAYRTKSPSELKALLDKDDPVGRSNIKYVQQAMTDAGLIVCAWGVHGSHLDQDETVLGWLPFERKIYSLGTTKDGSPKHPLYIAADTKLVEFHGRKFRRAG